jgi:hypothetical protein
LRGAALGFVIWVIICAALVVYINRAMWVGAECVGDARQVEVEVAELAPKD